MFDEFLSPWILLIKSLGVVLAVASGHSLGKEVTSVEFACGYISSMSLKGSSRPHFLLHSLPDFETIQKEQADGRCGTTYLVN